MMLKNSQYFAAVARYDEADGHLFAIDDVSGEQFTKISEEGAKRLRAASIIAEGLPTASLDNIGLGCFSLDPGERAIVPVRWQVTGSERVTECSTHPDAPDGLRVLPGECFAVDTMSLVVEN